MRRRKGPTCREYTKGDNDDRDNGWFKHPVDDAESALMIRFRDPAPGESKGDLSLVSSLLGRPDIQGVNWERLACHVSGRL